MQELDLLGFYNSSLFPEIENQGTFLINKKKQKMKTITLALLLLFKISFSQDYSKCAVFQDIINTKLLGIENQNVWDLKQRDTVYFNEDWLNKIKIGGEKYFLMSRQHDSQGEFKGKNYRIVYRAKYLREPTFKENYVIKYWSDEAHSNGYMINSEEKLIVDSGKIYKLIPDTAYYDTWFKVTQEQVEKELKQHAWFFSYPLISDSQKNLISYQPSRNDIKTIKLDGSLIDKNYSIFNPKKYINQKLLVSWIGQRNNQVQIVLRTFDKSAYFIHIFDRSIFYNEYPLLKTEAGKRLSEERNKFNEHLAQSIKDIKFTYQYRAFNNFKLNKIFFDKQSMNTYLIADKFNSESNFLKTDTILIDKSTEFYEYNCYHKTTSDFDKAKKIELEKYLKENFTEKEIKAIKERKIFIGMSEKALIESLGYPFDGINQTVMDGLNFKQYVYGAGEYVYISNGKISSYDTFNSR